MNKGSRKHDRWEQFKKAFRLLKRKPQGDNKFKIFRFTGEDMAQHVGNGAHKTLYPEKTNVIAKKYVDFDKGGWPFEELQIRNSDCGRYVNIMQSLSHHRWSCWQQVTMTVKDLETILRAVKGRRKGVKC